MIETLAAYAAVAIFNARLYGKLTQRDLTLTRRNENLALLNELASTLASSPDIDEILDQGPHPGDGLPERRGRRGLPARWRRARPCSWCCTAASLAWSPVDRDHS